MRFGAFAVLGLIGSAALAQVAPKPPPVIVLPDSNKAPGPVPANIQGQIPTTADGSFSVIGQGSIRWTGGFCAPKASESNVVCTRPVALNQRIVIQAMPRPGQEFKGWAGACSGQSTTCVIQPTKKFALSASFGPAAPIRTITAYVLKTPNGGINIKGAGLNFVCQPIMSTPQPTGPAGPYNSVCTASTNAPSVTIEATSVAGPLSTPVSGDMWKGPCVGQPGKTCTLTMTSNRTIHIGTPPAGPSEKTLTIYYWSVTNSTVQFIAKKRGYTPFGNDPGVPVTPNCSYIMAPMGMHGPGGTYNAQCTIKSAFVIVDLSANYVINGKSVPVEGPTGWLGGDCVGTPDSQCHVTLDKDRTVYVRPQPN